MNLAFTSILHAAQWLPVPDNVSHQETFYVTMTHRPQGSAGPLVTWVHLSFLQNQFSGSYSPFKFSFKSSPLLLATTHPFSPCVHNFSIPCPSWAHHHLHMLTYTLAVFWYIARMVLHQGHPWIPNVSEAAHLSWLSTTDNKWLGSLPFGSEMGESISLTDTGALYGWINSIQENTL